MANRSAQINMSIKAAELAYSMGDKDDVGCAGSVIQLDNLYNAQVHLDVAQRHLKAEIVDLEVYCKDQGF